MSLPINLPNLISGKTIESERIEFKSGWNPGAVYRTICAFANDFSNIGGGYIILGVEEKDGVAVRPVKGVDPGHIDAIKKEMIGLNNLINPVYHPKVSVEELDDKMIIVIWVPGGPNRPYEVPEEIKAREKKYHYYIRRYNSSVKTNKHEREELISLANQVPFDDRPNISASGDDLSYVLLKEHLRVTGSRLLDRVEDISKTDLLEQMELLSGPPEKSYPRNVSLMLFSDTPEKFFPYTQVEIVLFPKGEEDPEFTEIPPVRGPVQYIIKNTLGYLKSNLLKERVTKTPGKAEAERVWNYPYEALEEAVVNALYHRDYQVREPVEIRIYPNSLSILNYGGPDRSIKMQAFQKGVIKPRRYRNRRLGDFLKELELSEGKATGIPLIRRALKDNESPDPVFRSDDDRSFFEVEFFIHPAFEGEEEKSNEAYPNLKEHSSKRKGERSLEAVFVLIKQNPSTTISDLASEIGVSTRSIEKQIAELKKLKCIQRVGSRKTGYWKVLDDSRFGIKVRNKSSE